MEDCSYTFLAVAATAKMAAAEVEMVAAAAMEVTALTRLWPSRRVP